MLDNKIAQTRKDEFNRDEIFNIIFDSIKQNVDNKEYLDTDNLRELLKTCYNYYNDSWKFDKELNSNTRNGMAQILDILGTYKCKITR